MTSTTKNIMKQNINRVLLILLIPYSLFGTCPPPTPEIAPSEEMVNQLTEKEKRVYNQLGPIYRKVYLTFTPEQKKRVVVYTQRGINPYDSINSVLRVEQREYEKLHRKKLTPRERAEQMQPKTVILSALRKKNIEATTSDTKKEE